MHFHPVARHGAGFRVMIAASSVAVLAGLTSSIAASGQSAGDTIKRMQALYNTASTYQGTVKESQSGKSQQGQPFTATRSYAIKFKRPNMVKVLITVSGTGAAAVLNGTSMLTVLDGKTAYQYNEKTKQYLKQPAPPKVPILVSTAQAGLIPYDLSSAKIVSNTSVSGRPAVVIDAMFDTSKLSAAQRAAALKQLKPVSLTIDKANFALLHLHMVNGPSPIDVDLSGQSFNRPMSLSEFSFTPPADAKLVTPPARQPGTGGAAPSLPGGPPHR